MENKKDKVALNDELLEKVAGGAPLNHGKIETYKCKCQNPEPDHMFLVCKKCGLEI
jgi:hypothetical protein